MENAHFHKPFIGLKKWASVGSARSGYAFLCHLAGNLLRCLALIHNAIRSEKKRSKQKDY